MKYIFKATRISLPKPRSFIHEWLYIFHIFEIIIKCFACSKFIPRLIFSSSGMNLHSADPSDQAPFHSVSFPHGFRILGTNSKDTQFFSVCICIEKKGKKEEGPKKIFFFSPFHKYFIITCTQNRGNNTDFFIIK